jgi:HAMP domain-containing protein
MTDEERQKLCDKLRVYGKSSFHGGRACKEAADEIERLAARVNALEHIINLDMYEVTKTALVQAQDEIERLAKEIEKWKAVAKQADQNEIIWEE